MRALRPASPAVLNVQDRTNRENLQLLMQLRWVAVGGQILTMVIVERWFGIALPVAPMALVIALLALLNVFSLLRHRSSQSISNGELFAELLVDVAALTLQLYLSGGATNPFIVLYLMQVALGAILLEAWSTWVLASVAAGLFVVLTGLHRPLVLPPERALDLFRLYISGMFVCFVLAAGLLAVFIQRISRNLRLRDQRLADLRQRAAEEDHIVRMGLLASGAAHELGTPLATLSVILNDWRRMRPIASDSSLMQDIDDMQAQLDRCKAIVTGILMSSGEARGEGSVRTDVRAFVDDLVAEWRTLRSPARLHYLNRFAPNTAMVSDVALKQVILNVFDNALEASPHWVGIQVARRGDDLVLTVEDRGPGFDEAILAEFGKPYRSTKQRPGGGLGLFLVVNVMRKMGGTVSARNRPQGGASVVMTLPVGGLAQERNDDD
ncbi:ATP-binding protein [Bosea sp. TWI1241]|uniref:ATP-binding protein n=1 Tax=Bosea sp. TWI1241 TaxID=3148904 RepID=UPI00320AEE37